MLPPLAHGDLSARLRPTSMVAARSPPHGRPTGRGSWGKRTAHQEKDEPMECLDQIHREHQPKAKEPEFQGQPVAPIHLRAGWLRLFRWIERPWFRASFRTNRGHPRMFGLCSHGHEPLLFGAMTDTTTRLIASGLPLRERRTFDCSHTLR